MSNRIEINDDTDLKRILEEDRQYDTEETTAMKRFCADYENTEYIRNMMLGYLEGDSSGNDMLYMSLIDAAKNGFTDPSAVQEDCDIDQNSYTVPRKSR